MFDFEDDEEDDDFGRLVVFFDVFDDDLDDRLVVVLGSLKTFSNASLSESPVPVLPSLRRLDSGLILSSPGGFRALGEEVLG